MVLDPLKDWVQKEILNELSKELLQGKISIGDRLLIDSFNDDIVFRTTDEKKISKSVEKG